MEIYVTYNEKFDCVVGKFSGVLNPKSLQVYIDKIVEKTSKCNCSRFLNDLRQADIKFSIAEVYFKSQEIAKGTFDRSWKRAIVVNNIDDILEFFETAGGNQGLNNKVFTDYNEAINWLIK